MKKTSEIGVATAPPSLEVVFENIRHPEIFAKVASEIQGHVQKNKLIQQFIGKNGQVNNYPLVEAWQFAGALLGLFPRLVETRDLCKDNLLKYSATVEIIEQTSGKVISRGEAICSNLESKKTWFEEYAICSMAQTRATGKAFRLCLGWIMKAAGFEPAPAEEIEGYEGKEGEPGINDRTLRKEYKVLAMEAVNYCQKAGHVERIVNITKTLLGQDSDFLDAARAAWSRLANLEKKVNDG